MKKTLSKKAKIIELIKIGKKPSFIAKEVDVPIQTVYQTKHLWNKLNGKSSLNVAKKRGRPPKKQQETEQVRKFISDNIQLMDDNRFLLKENENLRHQIIGFRAVISYLENQVGLRNSQ